MAFNLWKLKVAVGRDERETTNFHFGTNIISLSVSIRFINFARVIKKKFSFFLPRALNGFIKFLCFNTRLTINIPPRALLHFFSSTFLSVFSTCYTLSWKSISQINLWHQKLYQIQFHGSDGERKFQQDRSEHLQFESRQRAKLRRQNWEIFTVNRFSEKPFSQAPSNELSSLSNNVFPPTFPVYDCHQTERVWINC